MKGDGSESAVKPAKELVKGMNAKDKSAAAEQFVKEWTGIGQEDEHCHKFWLGMMQDVLGVENALSCIDFEKKVKLKGGSTKRIDGYIARTRVLIEQKSIDIDLDKPQNGHDGQTPFEQAKFYNDNLNFDEKARWIIVSNFKEIRIYDMNDVLADPIIIMLPELPEKLSAFDILKVERSEQIRFEETISKEAGDLTQKLYDMLIQQYADPTSEETLHSLNELCVRIVFCLYAEDADEFADNQFHDYIAAFSPNHIRAALKDLFRVLDTPIEERDPDDDPMLLAFPYVNGGLFRHEIRIPQFTEELKKLIIEEASESINWRNISPTIFGAVFESTLSAKARRGGGMHYTSVNNIHKVIDPLFLEELTSELEEIRGIAQPNQRKKKLLEYQDKLASLTFLDPACGSGNFLTESYLSLRRLENRVISEVVTASKHLGEGQIVFDGAYETLSIKVDIRQFYGIEINDYAVSVAMTALWIAESQMMKETQSIINKSLDFLPLKTNPNIIKGNALRMDWNDVVASNKLTYIMGNPPFIGYTYQSAEQKEDLKTYTGYESKNIDYVSGWYYKAAEYANKTSVRCAFVSTNSITQGEQVAAVWKPLFERFGLHIDFAWRTFKWGSESNDAAAVHCVIVGFSSAENNKKRKLYINTQELHEADNINAYLVEAPTVFIEKRNKPISDVVEIIRGSQPTDDGNLILTEEEKEELLNKEPQAAPLIRPFMMGKDFIYRKPRYCLWLVGASPSVLRACPLVMERVERVRKFRSESKKEATRKKAETPTLFDEIKDCKTDYVAIPVVSSENRKYIPIDYISKDVIAGNKLFEMPAATLYHFGVLTSSVHMAWTRAVCGRLEMRYSYSNTIVYNNFPWCTPTGEQKAAIEKTAQAILDARAKYPNDSLADLYDEAVMPPELRKAHQANDAAVMKAYGFDKDMEESAIVAALMDMYQKITA